MAKNMKNEENEKKAYEDVKAIMESISDDKKKKCLQELLNAADEGAVLPVSYVAEKLKCSRVLVYVHIRSIVANLTQEQRESVYELL